jgi:uncharacterized protein
MERKRQSDEIKIRISGLSNGLHEYHFSSDPLDVGLKGSFTKPVVINAVIDKTPGQIYLKSDVTTSANFQCDRCLEEFDYEISTRCNMFYIYDELDAGKFSEDEVKVVSPDMVAIDFTDDVRQMILLAIPLKLLCREECSGLCPRCGTNWNNASCGCEQNEQTDPRWQGLQRLMKN